MRNMTKLLRKAHPFFIAEQKKLWPRKNLNYKSSTFTTHYELTIHTKKSPNREAENSMLGKVPLTYNHNDTDTLYITENKTQK